MNARCSFCPGLIRVQPETVVHQAQIQCPHCQKFNPLGDVGELPASANRHRGLAYACGQEHGLDIAGAYSVVLGIMTVERARVHRSKERLTERHGLPSTLAERVAGGEMKLHRAREIVVEAKARTGPKRWFPRVSNAWLGVGTGVAAGLAVFLFLSFSAARRQQVVSATGSEIQSPPQAAAPANVAAEPSPPAAAGPVRRGVHVELDEDGLPVRITASSPVDVLVAYCDARDSLRPVELAAPIVGHGQTWLGIFHDYEDLKNTYALSIHKNRSTRRWIAGDGVEPLHGFKVEQKGLGKERVAIREATVSNTSLPTDLVATQAALVRSGP